MRSSILIILSWGLLAAIVGVGGGYFAYVRVPPVFESSASILISKGPAESNGLTVDSAQATAASAEAPAFGPSEQEIDDRNLIGSEAVLGSAISNGQLGDVIEIHPDKQAGQTSPPSPAGRLLQSGQLRVTPPVLTSAGKQYTIVCRGKTPTGSQKMANGWCTAVEDYFDSVSTQNDWQQSVALMRESLDVHGGQLLELRQELGRLELPVGATLQGEQVVSAAAEKLRQLQAEADFWSSEQQGNQARLQNVEALIAGGADMKSILTALGQSTLGQSTRVRENSSQSLPSETQARALADAREAYRGKLLQRQKIEEEVERQLVPLQSQLDKLLKNVGSQHPTAQAIQQQIDAVRLKLDDLPPLGPEPKASDFSTRDTSIQETAPAQSADGPDIDGPDIDGPDINALVRALRVERRQIDQELQVAREAAVRAAESVGGQKSILEEAARLRAEIASRTEVCDEITSRLKLIPKVSPVSPARVEILQTALPGVQASPNLAVYLPAGAAFGLVSAIVLAGLLIMTSSPAADEADVGKRVP